MIINGTRVYCLILFLVFEDWVLLLIGYLLGSALYVHFDYTFITTSFHEWSVEIVLPSHFFIEVHVLYSERSCVYMLVVHYKQLFTDASG
jgi:hypothetical protein